MFTLLSFQWFDNMPSFEFWISKNTYYWSIFFFWPIRNLSSQLNISTNIFITNSQYSLFSILTNLPKSCQVHKIRSTQYFFDLSFTEFQMGYEKENNFRKQSVSKFKVIKKYHHKNLRNRYLFSNYFSSKRLMILNI